MAEAKERAGCWKIGCLGCGGLAVAMVLVFALVSVLQVSRDRGERPIESRDVVQRLPTLPELEALIERGELGAGGRLNLPDGAPFESPVLAGKVGTVELDLDVGEFEIVPGAAGEPIRVDGEYEEDAFRLAESFVEHDDGTWTYRVSMRPRGGMFGMLFRGAGNNPRNRITITLPRGQPFDLVGKVGLGSTRIELGGLLVRRLDLDAGTGEHEISFEEPLLAPMESFRLGKSIGDLRVHGLGNASPAVVEISQSIGEARIDLSGAWAGDADIRIENRIGEASVVVPDNVRVQVDRARVALGEQRVRVPDSDSLPADAPTLRLRLEGSIGDVRITGG
ncbi:MAG TPA: hypothetical protein VNB06_10010 [Thermoanaerobaculia bacterium]|nr:hypothetical protein [Thermoanaerobaculia bacterium]